MHVKYENTQVIEFPIMNLRHYLSNVSLPVDLTKDENLPEGYAYVTTSATPAYDSATQTLMSQSVPTFDGEKWVLGYDVIDLSPADITNKAAQQLEQLKQDRERQVNDITVTTQSGKSFDGNEDAQNRMSRAITAMDETDTIQWVLNDNTLATVTRDELREALRIAGAAMSQIWISPYV